MIPARMMIVVLGLSLELTGCRVSGLVFNCSTDTQCGPGGSCVDGYCAFSSDCQSGLRWDTSAGSMAGMCVPTDVGSDMAIDMATSDDMGALESTDLSTSPGPDMAHPLTWHRNIMAATSGSIGPGKTIWGSAYNDLYAIATDKATNHDAIWHSTDGLNWTEQFAIPSTATSGYLSSIWGTGSQNIYVVGGSYFLHSTGDGNWASLAILFPSGTDYSDAATIWGTGSNNYYISPVTDSASKSAVFHYSPTGAANEEVSASLGAIWGASATDVYGGFGFLQTVWHTTGNGTWLNEGMIGVQPFGVWGSGPVDVYVVGHVPNSDNMTATNAIYHSTDGTWNGAAQLTFTNAVGTARSLSFVYGTSATNVYAGSPVYHSTGDGTWSLDPSLNSMSDTLSAMWGTPDHLYAIGFAQDNSPVIWIDE